MLRVAFLNRTVGFPPVEVYRMHNFDCARRVPASGTQPPPIVIRSLHYFLPILDELRQQPPDPAYVAYLEHHVRRRLRGG